ncbi:aprataxin and PNK-like factor isoform X3 [Pundamilia nyererei]|uniref:Aprataxin and PNK-like factor isoform X3 n=1 Tax=Pundamilia nyererei TaxID=303518 RepID=A0A9Y3VUH8_9CICH|nr:PREDICTED: aprataxin and PNK-like factor isoform X3 [Pundamilia nyererei]
MSGFDLVPVDGGDPVHLPPGETVLGRGPLLGISDKRVSRHHGLLDNLSGELRLKATHLNPCFIQSTPTDDPRPLQKGSWHVLRHGDFFSLLPGRFIYEVVSVGGDERTPRNSQMLEEEEETLPVPPDPAVDLRPAARLNQEEPPPSAAPQEDEEAERPFKGDSAGSVKDDQRGAAPSVTRRRVLPAWMQAAVPAAKTPPSIPTVRTCRPAAPSPATKRAAVARATPATTSSPEEAEFTRKEEERPRKRRKLSDDEEQPEEAAAHRRAKPNRSEDSDENDSFTMKAEAEDKANESEKEGKMSENNGTSKRAEPAGSNGDAESGPAPSKARVRTPCPYGTACYRKNPLHFQDCSHPGDTDYEEEEEEEEEEDKPECPYGSDCYRKNPLHRKEYKHTKKPVNPPTARHVAKKTPADDEDEYEDSFINDDSEDAGDDSDYVPPDSDDSGKEDIKGLQREATAFLKRRK